MSLRAAPVLLVIAFVAFADVPRLVAQPAKPRPARRVALIVGVEGYLHDFGALKYTGRDASELAKGLAAGGFEEVVTLTGPPEGKHPATRANILKQLQRLTSGQANAADNIRKGDVVLVALSGHGLESDVGDGADKRREAFFALIDELVES